MDRARATRESVFRACDELLLAGQYPSARAVVAITKGSLSTVGPLRDEWWRLLAVNYRDSKYLKGLPPDVSDFLTGIWSTATSLASKAFEEQAAKLKDELSERERELVDSRSALEATNADLRRAQDSVDGLTNQVVQLQGVATRQAEQHASDLLALREQLRVANETNSRQAAEAQAAAADAARRLSEASESAAEERRRLLVQVDSARQESVRLAEASSAAATRHSSTLDALNSRLDAATLAADHALRDLAAARTEAATAVARLDAAERSNTALRDERDLIAARLTSAEATAASQSQLLAAQLAASQSLSETLDSLKRLIESERNADLENRRRRTQKKSAS